MNLFGISIDKLKMLFQFGNSNSPSYKRVIKKNNITINIMNLKYDETTNMKELVSNSLRDNGSLQSILETKVIPLLSNSFFIDVPANNWAYMYIHYGLEKGFFDKEERFYPARKLTRAELTKIIYKLAIYVGIIAGVDTINAPQFTDVPENNWAYPYIATLTKNNLLSGYKDKNGNPTGVFGPNDIVTRAQAVKVFINAAGIANYVEPRANFVDVDKNDWYSDYVSTAYNWSIIDDSPGHKFYPNDPVKREVVAKLLYCSINPQDRSGLFS